MQSATVSISTYKCLALVSESPRNPHTTPIDQLSNRQFYIECCCCRWSHSPVQHTFVAHYTHSFNVSLPPVSLVCTPFGSNSASIRGSYAFTCKRRSNNCLGRRKVNSALRCAVLSKNFFAPYLHSIQRQPPATHSQFRISSTWTCARESDNL